MILESIIDLLNIYVNFFIEEVRVVVQQSFNEIWAAEDNSDEVQHLVKMEEINFIIRKCIA